MYSLVSCLLFLCCLIYVFRFDKSAEIPFEVTSTVEKSYKMVCFAVSQKWPVLLYGPAGAGKTSLINNLARDTGNQGTLISFMLFSFQFMSLLSPYAC